MVSTMRSLNAKAEKLIDLVLQKAREKGHLIIGYMVPENPALLFSPS